MKLRLFALSLVFVVPTLCIAAGLTQHMFMSDIASELVTTPELVTCLDNNRDAYLAGAFFPDAGYAVGNQQMSEDAHSKSFIDAFISHIQQSYPSPYVDQYQQISFMMGAASHVADDPPYHAHFVKEAAQRDFNGNYDKAHTMCDSGLEFLTIVDFDRWSDIPALWLPLDDIVNTYALIGSSYSKVEIVTGNVILLVAAYAERLIASPVYNPLVRTMPWTAENYYDFPNGGLFNGGEVSAAYYETVWGTLMSSDFSPPETTIDNFPDLRLGPGLKTSPEPTESSQILYDFARRCLDKHLVVVEVFDLNDGSVRIGQPRITDHEKYISLLQATVQRIGK